MADQAPNEHYITFPITLYNPPKTVGARCELTTEFVTLRIENDGNGGYGIPGDNGKWMNLLDFSLAQIRKTLIAQAMHMAKNLDKE